MLLILHFTTLIVSSFAVSRNVLFIIVDDLRPALGCYGDGKAYTPNIDQFGQDSVIFLQAFAQQALCAPSRNSLLTSRRPDTLQLYDFYSYWRNSTGNFTTLPQHFKSHGYVTKSLGKVFHPGASSNYDDDGFYSWTWKPFHPYTNRFKDFPLCQSNFHIPAAANLVCPITTKAMPNKTLPDLEILKEARKFIRNYGKYGGPPFFLAVGFQKPHVPFKFPKRYLKYHPLNKFSINGPYQWPDNVSSVAYNPWIDLRKRDDVAAFNLTFPWEKIPYSFGELIIQSYYAAVTYVDALIGKLLAQLRKSGLKDNTIIILTSDHGWSLGEHAVWAKYSNFEVATNVPLVISIPEITTSKLRRVKSQNSSILLTPSEGKNTYTEKLSAAEYIVVDNIVELVDIFPTLADIVEIPIPICSGNNNLSDDLDKEITCSEGLSLFPIIKAAMSTEIKVDQFPWKRVAFWQYPRPGIHPTISPNSDEPRLRDIRVMGYSLRTKNYRYTGWQSFDPKSMTTDWNNTIAEELYDRRIDSGENKNLAYISEYAQIKKELVIILRNGWKGGLPPLHL